ncbi:unnamed protein product [Caenorhabditis angaria]|uniref:DUF38 domain-containing protein n=1 Tax=Caenorhabditis angaria TaxID=860376 RepID=A0A9P1IE20_9PELO|nr:unnamed protein product [Caenorhabditis angaria]
MRNLIFVVVFLIHLQLVASLTPQQAAEKFALDFWKYMRLRDTDIYHPDYKYIDKNGNDLTAKKIKELQSDEFVKRFRGKYEEALDNKNNFWEKIFWDRHIARFTTDGLLEIKEFTDNKLTSKWLMIRDSGMQGGYKLLKVIEYKVY